MEPDKGIYLLQLFVPLLVLPLTRPVGWVLVLPGLLFTLLSNYAPLVQPSFQYTSYWTPLLFIGVIAALEHAGRPPRVDDDWGSHRQWTLAVAFAATMIAGSYLEGAILQRHNVRSGFERVGFEVTDQDRQNRANLAEVLAPIDATAKVVASNHIVPHISNRPFAYSLKHAPFDAEWLVADESALSPQEAEVFKSALELGGDFGVVLVRGAFVLARRGAPRDRNGEALGWFFGVERRPD
jgi:uncharacterized membrane protein